MKTLFLLRHANAANPSGVADETRPLSAKGKKEAAQVGNFLKENNIAPQLWLSSSAKRTEETSKRVLLASGQSAEPHFDKALYLATAGEMIMYLNKLENNPEIIIVVGHNPGIEQLVKLLCGSKGNEKALESLKFGYPTATLSQLLFDIDSWSELEPNIGYLKQTFVP